MNRDKHSEWLHVFEYYHRAEFSQTAVKAYTIIVQKSAKID